MLGRFMHGDGAIILTMMGVSISGYLASSLLSALGKGGPAKNISIAADLICYGSMIGVAVKTVSTVFKAMGN